MPIRVLLASVLAGALAIAGCSSSPTIEGAVHAGAVPVYKAASLESEMGGDTYGDDFGHVAKSHSWFFATPDPVEKVIAFYEKALPGATRETDEQGFTVFRVVPDGAQPGEEVTVTCRPGEIQIHESYTMDSAKRAAAK
jgi:hypothetical protein